MIHYRLAKPLFASALLTAACMLLPFFHFTTFSLRTLRIGLVVFPPLVAADIGMALHFFFAAPLCQDVALLRHPGRIH